MKNVHLFRFWKNWGLISRLMLAVGVAIVAGGGVQTALLLAEGATEHSARLLREQSETLTFLAPLVADQALVGDYEAISQLLKQQVKRAQVERFEWTDPEGKTIAADDPSALPERPAWFAHLVNIEHGKHSVDVTAGGVNYGKLSSTMTPVFAENRLWQQFVKQLQIVGVTLFLMLQLIWLIFRGNLGTLHMLADGADRFSQGDHAVRIEPEGAPEVVLAAEAFNSMADNIQELLNSLNESHNTLFAEKERAQVTLASIADAVMSTDLEGKVAYLNPVAERLTGWSLRDAAGRLLPDIFDLASETGEPLPVDTMQAALNAGYAEGLVRHAILRTRNGVEHWIEHTASRIRNREGKVIGGVLAFRDVGESHKMAQQLTWQATHDPLTRLINRAEFERRLEQLVVQSNTDSTQHALLYLDLDQFKVVNDTCGHVAGDELLRQITALLQERVRGSDTLARLGGDEFGVLLNGCRLERAMTIAEGLREALTQFRFAWQDKTFVIGISIGVVSIAGGGEQGARVLAAADAACYSAKEKGRNRIQAYLPDDSELARRHGEMQWVSRLTRALEEERLVLYGQLIRALQRRGSAELHYEILLRMLDEHGELTPPMAFIPAAERYNLMPTIDRWVVARSFRAGERLLLGAESAIRTALAINISGASLNDDDFLHFVNEQFVASRVPPSMICFEITETAAISNLTRVARVIRELRALGCRFSLDDFGSGLSSFTYLKNLPVDYLKIDGSFVKDMALDRIDRAMVKAIHDIGQLMGIQTIAECVENDQTLTMLRDIGVDYVQGYGVEMPIPLEAIQPSQTAAREQRVLRTAAKQRLQTP